MSIYSARSPRPARSLAMIRGHPATYAACRGAEDPPGRGRAHCARLLARAWPPAGLEPAISVSRDGCWSVSESEPISGQLAQEVGGVAFPVGGVSGPGRLAKIGTFQASVAGQPPTAPICGSRGSCARRRPRSRGNSCRLQLPRKKSTAEVRILNLAGSSSTEAGRGSALAEPPSRHG